MASLQNLFTIIFILVLAFVCLFVNPSTSTSTSRLDNYYRRSRSGLKIPLKHVDSDKNLSIFQRLERGIKRGRQRLDKLNAKVGIKSKGGGINVTIHGGEGEYLMELAIGTPPIDFTAIMDTGSDLIWSQCRPCKNCFNQSTPIFNPKNSCTFRELYCTGHLCGTLPKSSCRSSDCVCEYSYGYGDNSITNGILAMETLSFGRKTKQVSVHHKMGFGCGYDQGGGFSEGAGIVGLGRGQLSLISQLDIEPIFSYCLTSIAGDDYMNKTSLLLMGSLANVHKNKMSNYSTTYLIRNEHQPNFYYLWLEGISVGGTRLPIEPDTFKIKQDGTGGIISDSGTTISYLEKRAFELVKKEFISRLKFPLDHTIGPELGFELCFKLPINMTETEVPSLVFHFRNADLDLPSENYLIADAALHLLCLAIAPTDEMSVFGAFQQQNMLVLHDLRQETISFIPAHCEQLL